MAFKPLPVGIEDFGEVIKKEYYYVDKTRLIRELLDVNGKVNLFTRPRRFGKTLCMSMIRYFFEDTQNDAQNEQNRKLFDGLKIMETGDRYTDVMGRYPVICISLKSGKQTTFELSYGCLKETIAEEFSRHLNAADRLALSADRDKFYEIAQRKASMQDYLTSLAFLSKCLFEVYQIPVIILIDEYDVPLENAYFTGFYEEMIGFIRALFESALKTNPYLEFAVITGCLRITKESIFTGLNNLKIMSILSDLYSEHFGFTQREVDKMLEFYGLSKHRDLIRTWYDGYKFGESEVYNPWSVINYVEALYRNEKAFPIPYWANTSSNSIVKELVSHADMKTKSEIEALIAGETVEKPVHEEITYADINQSENNLWNFLFFTGYLKAVSVRMEGVERYVTMAIPNLEVKYIYDNTVINWFRDEIKEKDLSSLYQALLNGDGKYFQDGLSTLLQQSISYMDSKEAFYHGFLLGILGNMKNYIVKSNREGGTGRLDIVVRSYDVTKAPVILELKVSDTFKGLDGACDAALKQIEEKAYDSWLPEEGYTDVWHYGVAFFRKQCRVKVRRKFF